MTVITSDENQSPSAPATTPASTLPTLSSIHIPSTQQEWLSELANPSGMIDGVPDVFLAIINQEEDSAPGDPSAYPNSSGFGGYFGLSEGQATLALLETTSQASFDSQAQMAAQDFATQLARYGGNPVEAEEAYQEGSFSPTKALSGGASLFEDYGIGANASVGSLDTSGSSKSSDLQSNPATDILSAITGAAGSAWDAITGAVYSEESTVGQGLSTVERDSIALFTGWTSFIQTMLLTAFFAIAALVVLFVLAKGQVGGLIPV